MVAVRALFLLSGLLLPADVIAVVDPVSIASAAASAIIAGGTLAGTNLNALMSRYNVKVKVGIEVENWTKYVVNNCVVQVKNGLISDVCINIMPGEKDAVVARQNAGLNKKSSGTVSWLINSLPVGTRRRLVVMWYAPNTFLTQSNALGVGLTDSGVTSSPAPGVWFDAMFNDVKIRGLRSVHKEFRKDISEIISKDDRFEIVGIMSSDHDAKVKILIKPILFEDLADSIKKALPGV